MSHARLTEEKLLWVTMAFTATVGFMLGFTTCALMVI
jgi:hypothetical protein